MDKPYPATAALADFAAALRYEDLPAPVQARMRALLVDFFRVGAAGVDAPWVGKLRDAMAGLGGAPTASVLYDDARTDPVRAAYLNATIAGSLEWDDTHVGAMLHPGVVVWPAVLAIGEMRDLGWRDLVAAAAAGYETMIRIGLSVQPSHFRRGFQSTATCGGFGAAVAAAKLLCLDATGIRDALGLAASYAGGLTQFFISGSEVKRLHAGKASAAGVECALFAAAGLSGPPDAIEGGQGFARALADAFDPAQITDGLGRDWRLLGLQMKPHATSARVLAAVESAGVLADQGIPAETIEAIEIGEPAVIMGRLTGNDPKDMGQTQMSSPWAVAMTFVLTPERPKPLVLSVEEFARSLDRPEVRALARRTTCVVDAAIERGTNSEYVPARVTVILRDGRRLEHATMQPTGCADRPMEMADLEARFRITTAGRLAAGALDGWFARLADPRDPPGARALMALRLRRALS